MDQKNDSGKGIHLSTVQWQSLTDLYRQLLFAHEDFYVRSYALQASNALHQIATNHSVPTTMLRYGIHEILEITKHQLPDSLEHMVSFIDFAYTKVGDLYEQIPTYDIGE